jgi:hypothetical protein
VGSLPGNKVSVDCSYYVNNSVIVTVPVWDVAGGVGSNAWYHVVGFAGLELTGCDGAKHVSGVWRRLVTTGPTTTDPGFKGGPLAVQLIQ